MRGCLKRVLIGIGALVVVIVAIAIIAAVASNGGSKNASSPTSAPAPSAPNAKPTPAPTAVIGHVGFAFRVPGNLDVRLTGYSLSNGNSIDSPKPGYTFAITHWAFHNFQGSNTDVGSLGFTVNSEGVIQQPEFASSLTNNGLNMSGVTLAPGARTTADLVFQVHRGDPRASIIYQPDSTNSSNKVVWQIPG